jgi:hypothetical protein
MEFLILYIIVSLISVTRLVAKTPDYVKFPQVLFLGMSWPVIVILSIFGFLGRFFGVYIEYTISTKISDE